MILIKYNGHILNVNLSIIYININNNINTYTNVVYLILLDVLNMSYFIVDLYNMFLTKNIIRTLNAD